MKKNIPYLLFLLLIAGLPSFSQKYKTASDTARLNVEYTKVNGDIVDLTAKLNKAQSDLDRYTKKANEANSDAQSTAAESSDKAAKATNGSVKDAKKAKREARRSVRDAKDARNAQDNLDDQNKKIASLTRDLNKKQDRLKELDAMRASISVPQQ